MMAQRQPASFELNGALTTKSYNIRVYPSSAGITVYWIDITERKRAEVELKANAEALRESEQREKARRAELEAIMDAVPAFMWISHDPQAREMTGNQATLDLMRMRRKDNLSKSGSEPEKLRLRRAHFTGDISDHPLIVRVIFSVDNHLTKQGGGNRDNASFEPGPPSKK